MQTSPQKLVILDIDETLVYATEKPLEREADFRVGDYHVYKRPFLNEFIMFCFDTFAVAVWTTSTESYADEMLNRLLTGEQKPVFIWTREKCTYSYDPEIQEHFYSKKISKLRRRGYDLDLVIAVDDSPNVWSASYGNLVRVSRFQGDEDDAELPLLS